MTVADFTSVINSILPEPHAGLLNGILFGSKATLTPDLYDSLLITGTLHVIALSGMNITILTNLVSITLLRFISKRIASLLTIGIIIGFILFVGPSSSVIRAGIMGSLSLLAVVFGRQNWSLLFLTIAALSMLIVHPAWITDIGFQLSVAATLGIILFGKKILSQAGANPVLVGPATRVSHDSLQFGSSEKNSHVFKQNEDSSRDSLARVTHKSSLRTVLFQSLPIPAFKGVFVFLWSLIEDDLRITLAAQVFTIPLILFHFHRVSLVSPLTNVLIGWIIQPITVLGLVAAISGWIFLPMGMVIAWVVWVPLQYMILAIQITSMLPFASLGK